MSDDAPGFGSPQTVTDLANTGHDVATTLDKLQTQVNKDVMATVPDLWGGEGADAFTRFWAKYTNCIGGVGSASDTWCQGLTRAAETMTQAKRQLSDAEQFASGNGLAIGQDLVVRPRDGNQPVAADVVAAGQQRVDAARKLARESQQDIRDANANFLEAAARAVAKMVVIGMAIWIPRKGGRGMQQLRVGAKQISRAEAAEALGYTRRIPPQKAPFDSHGQEVFTNGRNYITPDLDEHNTVGWKMFNRKGQRMGTYDMDLNYVGE